MKLPSTNRRILAASAAFLAVISNAAAQAVWDGGSNANTSGNWITDPSFWNPDGVPDALAVELNDVSSGTRTVTLDAAATVTSLAINQSTVDAVNALTLTTAALDLSITDASGFTMTNSTGQVGAINLTMTGADIRLTNTASSTVTLDGTVSLSNGSRFVTSNSGAGSIYNINGGLSLAGGGDNGSPGLFVVNGAGAYNVADGATVNVAGGLAVFGRGSSGSTNRGQTLNNSGEVTVENGATFRLDAVQGFEISDFNNSATTILGDAVTAGQAILDMDTSEGGSGGVGRFDNLATGVLLVNGSSHLNLGNRSDAAAHAIFTNADGGEATFAGDLTGAGIRSTFGANDQVHAAITNSGALTVTHHASGTEGLGVISHAGGAARLVVTNAATGVLTIEDTADLAISTANSRGGVKTVAISNAGTMVVGEGAADTANGSLVSIAARGTSDTATAATVSFANSGSLLLEGASVVELAADSVMEAWSFTNEATGIAELNGTSAVGNASTALTWINAGTLNKTGTGAASILSDGTGTATNTGTIAIEGGSLSFTESLDASAAASLIKVIVAPAVAAPQITTTGTMTYGGTLELVVNTATPAGAYNLFDSAAVAGAFANITLSGSGGFSGTADGSSIFNGGFTFAFNGATGELTVTEGEPEFTPLEQWRIDNFGSAANSGNGADDFDFDFDGIDNLLEYATGSNPKSSSGSPITAGEAGGFLTVSFNRIADPALTYTVKAGNDLSGFPATIFTSSGAANVAGPVTATDTQPIAGNPKRFARLEVTY